MAGLATVLARPSPRPASSLLPPDQWSHSHSPCTSQPSLSTQSTFLHISVYLPHICIKCRLTQPALLVCEDLCQVTVILLPVGGTVLVYYKCPGTF